MYLLKAVNPLEATGYVKEAFSFFGDHLALPIIRLSASEGALKAQMDSIGYYMKHPHLSAALLAAIRLRCAVIYGASACVNINLGLLKSMGMEADSLKAVQQCEIPNVDDLEENEQAMLYFVGKAHATPETITQEDAEGLRGLGWTDGDILDAIMHGENMHRVALVEKALVRGE